MTSWYDSHIFEILSLLLVKKDGFSVKKENYDYSDNQLKF